MHAVGSRVLRAPLAQLEAALELHRRSPSPSRSTCSVTDRCDRAKGDSRAVVQDLVRPGAPDARDHALVAEQRVQPARLRRADLPERVSAEAERLRAEVRELRLGGLRRQQPHAGALLRPRLGQDESRAAFERELEGRDLRPLLAGTQVAEPPRAS